MVWGLGVVLWAVAAGHLSTAGACTRDMRRGTLECGGSRGGGDGGGGLWWLLVSGKVLGYDML